MNQPLSLIQEPQTVEQEEVLPSRIKWEGSQCFLDGKPWTPIITEFPPHGNTVMITLDAGIKADLDWEKELLKAESLAEQGYLLFWNFDFEIMKERTFCNYTRSQVMTFSLAIEQFIEKVWPRFTSSTVGISLYRGIFPKGLNLQEGEEIEEAFTQWLQDSYDSQKTEELRDLFAADLFVSLFDALSATLPLELSSFILVDMTAIKSPLQQALSLSKERVDTLRFIVKGSLLPLDDMGWATHESPFGVVGKGTVPKESSAKSSLAVCIPELQMVNSSCFTAFDQLFSFLSKNQVPFRIIPEAKLITEWEGLDDLIVTTEAVSIWGLRKLQGFCAAGGTIISQGELLNVAKEISFEEWASDYTMKP